MKYSNKLTFIHKYITRRLESPAKTYKQFIHNNLDNLYTFIRPGDVVLVEGDSEMSRIIKLFANSHWSHSALYIGDELLKKGRPLREEYLKAFGEDARHLVIEAIAGKGVIVSPLRRYLDYNIRVCRPFGLRMKDIQTVMTKVIGNLGKRYDQRNILDIALMLLPSWMNPFKKRSMTACLGNCNNFQVICSGMIAQAFQCVGYPIIPGLKPRNEECKNDKKNPYGANLVMRHYSQILPRDYDLSPNFDIIKFNIIEGGEFNYKALPWDDESASG